MCILLFIKILAEFNRIMGKDMLAVYREHWKTLMQDVLAVAMKEKDNIQVQTAIKLAGRHLSDGMINVLTIKCKSYVTMFS